MGGISCLLEGRAHGLGEGLRRGYAGNFQIAGLVWGSMWQRRNARGAVRRDNVAEGFCRTRT